MTKCQIKRDAWYMHYIIRLCKLYKYCWIHQNYLGSRCTILIVLHLQFKLNCSILLKDKIELESACKKKYLPSSIFGLSAKFRQSGICDFEIKLFF